MYYHNGAAHTNPSNSNNNQNLQAMNQPYYPDLVFTLSELLDNGVVQHADFITELSAASSGEAQLQESLESISKVTDESADRRALRIKNMP